jgi:thiamine-monophosphate kinase
MSGAEGTHVAMGDGREFDAIRRLLALWGEGAVGIGDDAAVLDLAAGERLVASTDATVDGVHFRRDWLSAEEIGARATAAALSDLAAMAARPIGLLVAIALPEEWSASLDELARGIGMVAWDAGCPIVGGNMTRGRELSLTLTVLGGAVDPLHRSGAEPGDIIFVTGSLGGPGAALQAFLAGAVPRDAYRERFARPVPRLAEARWLAAHGARAAIDLSDGLLADAAHLAKASRISLDLEASALPCMPGITPDSAAQSGEEYELLVAAPPSAAIDVNEFERQFGIPLTAVGVARAPAVASVTLRGSRVDRSCGHDHFS